MIVDALGSCSSKKQEGKGRDETARAAFHSAFQQFSDSCPRLHYVWCLRAPVASTGASSAIAAADSLTRVTGTAAPSSSITFACNKVLSLGCCPLSSSICWFSGFPRCSCVFHLLNSSTNG